MSVTLHPRLREQEEAAATTAAEASTSDAVENPEVNSEVAPAEAPAQDAASGTQPDPGPPIEDNYLKIDKTRLYEEIQRLDREDPAFREIVRTYGGRKAKRALEAQLAELQAELEEERQRRKQIEFRSMTPEEIEERFGKDPQFARDYAETVHAQPSDPNLRRAAMEWNRAFQDLYDEYENRGIPPQWTEHYHKLLTQGRFDRDAQGNPLTPQQAFNLMRRTLDQALAVRLHQQQSGQSPPAQAAQPAAQVAQAATPAASTANAPASTPASMPQPKRDTAMPDVSGDASHPVGGRSGIPLSQYNAMTPPEKINAFPEGLQAAMANGKVYRD